MHRQPGWRVWTGAFYQRATASLAFLQNGKATASLPYITILITLHMLGCGSQPCTLLPSESVMLEGRLRYV